MHLRADDIAAWLRARVSAAGAEGLVVGLSGGIDSAVVAGLCHLALPDRTLGLVLPCGSDPRDEEDARLAADHFQIPVLRVDLAPIYVRLTTDLQSALGGGAVSTLDSADDLRARLPAANVKPRLRMACLYFAANTRNYLVAGTGNRSELTIGYFTKYGDGGTDVLPIGHLLKSEVRALAAALKVPQSIIDKPPTAGLWPGQTDEGDMGFSYADLERYLTLGPEGVPPALALRIERLVRQTEHKRALPPTPAD